MTFADEAERAGRELVDELEKFGEQALAKVKKMRDRYRQRVEGRFEMASTSTKATVWIDRANTFHVRPYMRRRVYSAPVEMLAQWVVREQIRADVRGAKKKNGRKARKARR